MAEEGPLSGLRVMVPNSPGSGYDTTAREWAQVMEDEGIAEAIEVFNLEGAGGTVGLQRLVNEEGNAEMLMQMGLGVVGAQYSNQSEATLDQTTPIAKLIEEAEAIVVLARLGVPDAGRPGQAWSADPGDTPVGGASNPGGPDHLTPMLLAEEVGVTPADVNYVAYDGGGELLAGILGGDVAFAATGVGEVSEAGRDRRRAHPRGHQRGAGRGRRRPDPAATRASTSTFTNWRGVVAAPGITDEERQRFVDAFTEMHDSDAWQQVLEDQGWTDSFVTGDEFSEYLQTESDRVEGVLSELGLT